MSPVQTKCACGHSLAAHKTGPCVGLDLIRTDISRHRPLNVVLCNCEAAHETYTVPAVSA